MTQGERVKEVRTSMNMTLEGFGSKLGVTKVAVSNIEKGNRSLTEQMATAICRTYNVNYDWLMEGEGEMFDDLPQTIVDELCKQYDLDDMDRALVEMYISFSEECRAEIKSAMRNIISKVGNDSGNE